MLFDQNLLEFLLHSLLQVSFSVGQFSQLVKGNFNMNNFIKYNTEITYYKYTIIVLMLHYLVELNVDFYVTVLNTTPYST